MLTVEQGPSGLIDPVRMVEVQSVWVFETFYRHEYSGLVAVAAALTVIVTARAIWYRTRW